MKTELKLISVLIANLFVATAASAADGDFVWSGEVGAGVRGNNAQGGLRNGAKSESNTTDALTPFVGPRDEAKFNEYRDLKHNNLTGTVDVQGRSDKYHLNIFGENIGLGDQYLNLQGGRYGVFKYRLYDDKLVHNLSWNALTPFTGAGTANLTYPGVWNLATVGDPLNNPASWNSFDYGLKRNNFGGHFEFSNNSPWYIRADANEVLTKGIRPMSAPFATTSSSQGFVELATPVDYKTQNFTVEGGYASKRGQVNVSVLRSTFSNNVDSLNWQNARLGGGTSVNLLPPDNVMHKVGVNGVLRQLPLGSTLTGRLSYSRLTDSFDVQSTNLNDTTGASSTTLPSSPRFDGNHTTKSAALSLTSAPMKSLDTKLYGNWYQKENQSTQISYAAGTGGANAITALTAGELFSYKKVNAGFDLGYRINPAHKLAGGFEWKKVVRTAGNAPLALPSITQDKTYYAEYRNSSLDALTGRFKYEYATRNSGGYLPGSLFTSPGNSTMMATANFNQHRVKLVLDANPAPLLDLGFQAAYKKSNYVDRRYGAQSDAREEYSLNVSYGDATVFRVTAFADLEIIKFDDLWYAGTLGAAPSTTNFDVGYTQKTTNKMLGLGADWPVLARFTLNASYLWSKTGGGVDFTNNATATTGTAFFSGTLPSFVTDNTTKHSLNLKGKYTVDKNWSVTGGYAFEKYKYNDDQMIGFVNYYPYYMSLGATNNSILSGAFQNPSYKAHIFYLTANYKF